MSRVFSIIKVVASAGVVGSGIGFGIIGVREIMGADPAETLVYKLVLCAVAPVLAAVVAYRHSEQKLTIRHVVEPSAIPLSKLGPFA